MQRIILNKVSKQFSVDGKKDSSALETAIGLFNRQAKRKFLALNNVSFSAEAGENIGIIGRNGSGKSTLLRAIAGIYSVDSGCIKTEGKIVYLNGLAQGLQKKLTARENIYLMGSLLGLRQKDIKNKFSTIIEFSGIGEFVDTKVYQFSSGMIARLGFSATIHFVQHHNPDIILLDEVFGAGGDMDFQKKTIEKMGELIKGGATVLLASHDLDIINQYCHRVIWLDKGQLLKQGEPRKICYDYTLS